MKVSMFRGLLALAAVLGVVAVPLTAQDRLKSMPGYDQYQKMAREIPGSVKLGSLTVRWKDDGSSFEYAWNGKRYVFDVASKQAKETGEGTLPPAGGRGGRG